MSEHTTTSEIVYAAVFFGVLLIGFALVVVPLLGHLAWDRVRPLVECRMTPRTTPIVCARAPRHIVYVPAVRGLSEPGRMPASISAVSTGDAGFPGSVSPWRCSWCGAQVRVVA